MTRRINQGDEVFLLPAALHGGVRSSHSTVNELIDSVNVMPESRIRRFAPQLKNFVAGEPPIFGSFRSRHTGLEIYSRPTHTRFADYKNMCLLQV
jgi:hypothetical protein